MNAAILPTLATPFEGGFYAGRIQVSGVPYALIVAPKAEGDRKPGIWSKSEKMVAGATSYFDGLANTQAMAEIGSTLAKWALGLTIGGFSDWYLPAVDELEIAYRYLKPTTEENSCWARSGINLSALPPTYPYTPAFPAQTENPLFRVGGAEAFEEAAYWSSTQHASYTGYAWFQDFSNGYQGYWIKDYDFRARAVRRLAI